MATSSASPPAPPPSPAAPPPLAADARRSSIFSLAQRRAIEAEAHVAEAEPLLPDEFGEQLRPIVMQFRGSSFSRRPTEREVPDHATLGILRSKWDAFDCLPHRNTIRRKRMAEVRMSAGASPSRSTEGVRMGRQEAERLEAERLATEAVRAIEAETHVAEVGPPPPPDEFGEQLWPLVMQFRGRSFSSRPTEREEPDRATLGFLQRKWDEFDERSLTRRAIRRARARRACVAEAEGMRLHLSRNSSTGYRGVSKKRNRFIAQYTVDGRRNKLAGSFGTAVEAAVAYARAIDKTVVENGMRWTHSLADVCGAGAWSTHLLIILPHMHSRCALLPPILVPHIARR